MADTTDQVTSQARDGASPAPQAPSELELIVAGEHGDPHRVLGFHDGVVRAYRPDALAMRVLPIDGPDAPGTPSAPEPGAPGTPIEMVRIHPGGIFEAEVPTGTDHYHLQA